MALSEEAFSQRVESGCSACGGKKVVVEAYVARKFVLLEGEVYGSPSWGYKGEDLVRGTYAIRCAACAHVLYEDDAIIAVDKPAGLPVHPTARYLRNTLTAVLDERYPKQIVHLCHRLDKETSGVIVAARSVELEVKLKAAFAGRDVKKRYLAITHGAPREEQFLIDAPMALAGHEVGVLMAITPVEKGGLPSRTRVRVLERFGAFSLLECAPETGRQHQIRLHLAHVGTPIVGDKLYAHSPDVFIASLEDKLTDEQRALLMLERHALHAAAIQFDHPKSGAPIEIEAPLPKDMRAFIAAQKR